VPDLPAGAERDDAERGERREHGDDRRDDVRGVDGRRREEALLADQLDEVGDRLQQPEGTGAIRAVAVLHAPEQLAFEPRRVREGEHDEVDDHQCLDERDPPDFLHLERHLDERLQVAGVLLGDPHDTVSKLTGEAHS
jgi:hypothetical protein